MHNFTINVSNVIIRYRRSDNVTNRLCRDFRFMVDSSLLHTEISHIVIENGQTPNNCSVLI